MNDEKKIISEEIPDTTEPKTEADTPKNELPSEAEKKNTAEETESDEETTEPPTDKEKEKSHPKGTPPVLVVLLCAAALAAVLLVCRFLLFPGNDTSKTVEPTISATPESAVATPEEAAPTETPIPTEETSDLAVEAMAKASTNATKDAPQITDPATWNKNGKEIMEALCADPYYQEYGMTLEMKLGYPFLIAVNRAASTVTVYTVDMDGRYTIPYIAMVCSGGSDTPLGYWTSPVKYDWHLLSGPCYGQYSTRIWDCYLFHSVPYYTEHQDDLEYDEYNQLGTPASLGCIRLAVVDVKWIYDNCPIGTPVVIYDDAENPGPMGKPGTIYIDPTDTEKRGWDPTDPNPQNPWDEQYRTGTAIRSEAAWQQWEQMQGFWAQSINVSNLQGWSHDSAIEGTRG